MSVLSVSASDTHTFSKVPLSSIILIKDLGVQGDCHNGSAVQHRSRLHIRPSPPNLRQVHLMQSEILEEFGVRPAEIGENITTAGLDLLGLGKGTMIHFLPLGGNGDSEEGRSAPSAHPVVRITGLRNPCPQIEQFRSGLQEKFIVRNVERKIVGRKAGVMGIVEVGGLVQLGMRIKVEEPPIFEALQCV